MTHHDLFMWQAVASLVIAGAFLFQLRWAIRFYLKHRGEPYNDEHGMVVVTGLFIVSLANALTSYAAAIESHILSDIGGVIVRGVLLTMVVYLLAAGPFHRPHPRKQKG